jgi:TP53 regulating kinase-like protein
MAIIAQGAEATIEKKGKMIIKHRVPKSYRLSVLDEKLRRGRTRSEAKIFAKLNQAGFPAPKVEASDDASMDIHMEYIDGPKVRDALAQENASEYAKQIGTLLCQLHEMDIVHADLTTSNMIVRDGKVHFIDFGLSYISKRTEDKAVDLHLLRRALDSYHHEIAEKMFADVCIAYSDGAVLDRLKVIDKRGRYKQKH